VGGENTKIYFRINDLCLWCARRAVAFAAISMGCQDLSNHKVQFKRKSTFQRPPTSGLPTDSLQIASGKTKRASKPRLRPMTGEMSVRLPPICFMTLSTMASPRPPPAPTEHPRTKGFFRVSAVAHDGARDDHRHGPNGGRAFLPAVSPTSPTRSRRPCIRDVDYRILSSSAVCARGEPLAPSCCQCCSSASPT